MMKVNLRLLPPGGISVEGTEEASIIDISDPVADVSQPVSYQLRVVRAGQTLVVRGSLETGVTLTCSRCLEKFPAPLLVPGFGRELELLGDESIIDLTGDIREDIILAIPVKPLCRADCQGLCPICGADRNRKDCGCYRGPADSPFDKLDRGLTGNNSK